MFRPRTLGAGQAIWMAFGMNDGIAIYFTGRPLTQRNRISITAHITCGFTPREETIP